MEKITKKILVISTGGTIGSAVKNNTINLKNISANNIIHDYAIAIGKSPELIKDMFEVRFPINILSENLISSDWNLLINDISKTDLSKYAGIIINHGTDTLPYTSSMLSFVFNNINIPIVLVSSNHPLGCVNSNGIENFIGAVNFIQNMHVSGVFVSYKNNKEKVKIHLGSRLIEASPFINDFRSQKDSFLGTIENEKFIFNKKNKYVPQSFDEINKRQIYLLNDVSFSNEIMFIKPYPGLNYKLFDFSKNKPKAILHSLYHSGTACVRNNEDNTNSIIEFVNYCSGEGIDFYVAPLSCSADNLYVTSEELLKTNIHTLEDMTVEASIAKLSIVYGTFKKHSEIESFLRQELFFEFTKLNA